MIKTVLFDLDGTLLDTAPDLTHALNQTLVRHGKAPVTLERLREVVSLGSPGMIGLGFGIPKTHPDYTHLRDEFRSEYENTISDHTVLFPGMAQVLDTLEADNIAWGIVTNKPHHLAEKLLAQLGLLERAHCLVGAGITKNIKPDPEQLLYACDLLKTSPEACVYIGDAQSDIEAAQRAEMTSIVALYGYISQLTKPESWAADYYIDAPGDLISWLTKRRA